MYLPTLRSTSRTIEAWLMTWSSYEAIGWRLKKRSCPCWAATSAAARVSRRPLLMCSIFTWTSFFSPHAFAQGSSHWSYEGTKCTHVSAVRSPASHRPLYLSGPANENGAAAPAIPIAAAPAPACLMNSRRLRCRGSSLVSVIFVLSLESLSERPACEPRDEAIEERVVDKGQRDGRNQDRRHDARPVVEITANQVGGNPDRQRAVGR